MAKDITLPDPAPLLDLLEAFRRSKTMFAAVQLGVFDQLSSGPQSVGDLAKKLDANADALERLLDACIALQLLTKDERGYHNTPLAATYLCQASPHRFTGYIYFSNNILWKLWANLEQAIREGTHRWQQTFDMSGPIFSHFFKNDETKREFLMGMHGYGVISSPKVVSAFDLSRFQTLIDLGGATGHLAIAACQRHPQMQAIVSDLPEAISLAREVVAVSPVADRIDFHAGDFFKDPLPEGDLVALGRILHDWTEEKILKLLKAIYERLPKGGGLLLAEILLAEDKTGPRWAHMQSLNMLVCTEGKERTLTEYEALLRQIGFGDVQGCRTGSPLDAVLAIK